MAESNTLLQSRPVHTSHYEAAKWAGLCLVGPTQYHQKSYAFVASTQDHRSRTSLPRGWSVCQVLSRRKRQSRRARKYPKGISSRKANPAMVQSASTSKSNACSRQAVDRGSIPCTQPTTKGRIPAHLTGGIRGRAGAGTDIYLVQEIWQVVRNHTAAGRFESDATICPSRL